MYPFVLPYDPKFNQLLLSERKGTKLGFPFEQKSPNNADCQISQKWKKNILNSD